MTLIALGGAKGVWDELEEALTLCPDADVGAVNEAGRDYTGHLTLWASLHPEKFHRWQRGRERNGLNTDFTACCHKKHFDTRVDFVTNDIWGGTSGLFLCQIAAINFGYSRIIVCGMPISDSPKYFTDDQWKGVSRYRKGWTEATQQPELKGKIRSMSGWTRELVGPPDSEWLAVPA